MSIEEMVTCNREGCPAFARTADDWTDWPVIHVMQTYAAMFAEQVVHP